MSTALNRWIYGLLHLGLALPIIGGVTLLPIIANLVVREIWPGHEAVITAATFIMAVVGYILAWRGGRWLARRAGSGTDIRSAVLLSGVTMFWHWVKTDEGMPILLGSIVALSLPSIAMMLGAGYEHRQAITAEAGRNQLTRPSSGRRRALIMCVVSVMLPGAVIMIAFAVSDLPTTVAIRGMVGILSLLVLVAASWLLGRWLCRWWPWHPVHLAFGLVPVLLSQWPLLLMALSIQNELLAWAAVLFMFPVLGFLAGFGLFRRRAA